MIKVLIADDHMIVRQGIKKYLDEASDIIAHDEASNGQEVLLKTSKHKYDVVLLDISMPGRSGLDIVKQLKNENPDTKVLMLSMHPEEEYAERSLQSGASGYLTKKIGPNELIDAIRKVSSGEKYISPAVAQILASNIGPKSQKLPHQRLSDREYEIMCLIASGKTLQEIADELSLSPKTVSTHRAHILEKTGMKSNAQLIKYGLKNKLIE